MTRKNDLRAIRVLAALVVLLVLLSQPCKADELTWLPPETDEDGNALDPAILYYKLYWGYANSDYNYADDFYALSVNLDAVPPGCYYLSLTAVRTDTDPELESAQSESVYYCAGNSVSIKAPLPPAAEVTYE